MRTHLLLALFLVACGSSPAPAPAPAVVAVEADDAFRVSWEELQAELASGECRIDRRCGALSFVNCRIEADGPGYYVDEAAREILAVCGGACMLRAEGTCANCPPAAWTCPE